MRNLIYLAALIIFIGGLLIVILGSSYKKKIIGLSVFQNAVLIFYIALSKINDGIVPVSSYDIARYTSPVPHVLMLTAIVVGFSTLAVALVILQKIHENFGTTSHRILNLLTSYDNEL